MAGEKFEFGDRLCSHKECSLKAEYAVKIQPPIALKYTVPASLIYCCETHYDDVIKRAK